MFYNTASDVFPDSWNILQTKEQLDEIIHKSFKTMQVIFKHSVTCGISAMAKDRLEKDWTSDQDMDFYYLDLLSFRSISNEVADRFGVVHQSPQIILVKDGVAIDKTSHHAIHYHWIKERITD